MIADKPRRRPRNYFTPQEDQLLAWLVNSYGEAWQQIAQVFQSRTPRQCKERWTHYISPDVDHSPWTTEEDALVLQKAAELGRQWKLMERFFPGRKDSHLKNRHNALLRRAARRTPTVETSSDIVDESPDGDDWLE
jgi:hypothetical protein